MLSPGAQLQQAFFRVSVILLCIVAEANLVAGTPNPYPNEIRGLKLYLRFLSPLIPLQSDAKQVLQVLGTNQTLDLKNWRITVLYSCRDDFKTCSHGPRNDPVDTIEVVPKHRVSLLRTKIPQAFSHSYGGVSEINVTCDVYSDEFGLEYWVVSGNFPSHKKADLLMIRYGGSRASKRQRPPK